MSPGTSGHCGGKQRKGWSGAPLRPMYQVVVGGPTETHVSGGGRAPLRPMYQVVVGGPTETQVSGGVRRVGMS